MTAAISAAVPAATAAAQPYFDPVNAVNTPAGTRAQETYPGALDASQYSGTTDESPTTAGGPGGPPYGSWTSQPFTSVLPEQAPGGGYQDTAWQTGHDGPQAPWDSSAGLPFAPSGALPAELHGEDTGAVFQKEYVVPAGIGSLTRHTATGETTVRNGGGDQVTKDNVTAPNGRANLDQQQWHNPNGWGVWTIPYAERPVQNNLAYESVRLDATDSPYTPSGQLPDRSTYDYAAMAYTTPPDPAMGTVSPQAAAAGIGEEWVL